MGAAKKKSAKKAKAPAARSKRASAQGPKVAASPRVASELVTLLDEKFAELEARLTRAIDARIASLFRARAESRDLAHDVLDGLSALAPDHRGLVPIAALRAALDDVPSELLDELLVALEARDQLALKPPPDGEDHEVAIELEGRGRLTHVLCDVFG